MSCWRTEGTLLRSAEVPNDGGVNRLVTVSRGAFIIDDSRGTKNVGFSNNTSLIRYGPEWRKHRKLMNKALGVAAVQRDFSPLQEWGTRMYLYNLLQKSDDMIENIHR